MESLTVGIAWGLSMVSLLIGYGLGRKSAPTEIYEQSMNVDTGQKPPLAERIRTGVTGKVAPGEVVGLSDEQLAKLEQIQKEWEEPNDPNDGIPGYLG